MSRDGIPNTIIVALCTCLVCSFLVSAAAIGLRDRQDRNRSLDIKSNIVSVAGFSSEEIRDGGGVEEMFRKRIQPMIINLETGEEAVEEVMKLFNFASADEAYSKYDQFKASKAPLSEGKANALKRSDDIAGISNLEKYGFVYLLTDEAQNVKKYILPIRGRGLWSTLKGFIALDPDLQTVAGLTYYEHAETPGLGGEVDNPGWKKSWIGKKVYAAEGKLNDDGSLPDVKLNVAKGTADNEFSVDGLAGATITARGVSEMVQFWLNESGYGRFIANRKARQSTSLGLANSGENSDG
ncbi:MAG TPA: Na(+)-translocating NADH-quinone reductase subunit C [Pirellulaceae bacterium]|nr:Na(+)-translocating NADH-quinone reductase subunit C [Pirellulaceae bacterium]HMO91961.1 Na(+)-translocating NADH-quinone reductase subunit C [Pirellulaceae bacterium]HMP68760.1 Na(+)-translocating NADH-quinone reductase subunit C [Pirellulaceae bacterium]